MQKTAQNASALSIYVLESLDKDAQALGVSALAESIKKIRVPKGTDHITVQRKFLVLSWGPETCDPTASGKLFLVFGPVFVQFADGRGSYQHAALSGVSSRTLAGEIESNRRTYHTYHLSGGILTVACNSKL
jgi:hypothetical protein